MPLTGTLRSWHEDRGFGFIAPKDGGRELFVHISAFPRDGSRPTVGESLTYELGRGKDGKPQAVRVFRWAIGAPSTYPTRRRRDGQNRRSPLGAVIGLVLMLALTAYGYTQYQSRVQRPQTATTEHSAKGAIAVDPSPAQFRCDGRTHCSQMTSCSEATFFLRNCPGVQMDGNHDGVPCEQQWCTGASVR